MESGPKPGKWRFYTAGQEVFIRNSTPFHRLKGDAEEPPEEGEVILIVSAPIGAKFKEEIAAILCEKLNACCLPR